MAESLYSMLSKMLNDEAVIKEATKKAREKIKKSYDKQVRRPMIQYYLDQYDPLSYKRVEPSPLFLAYKTHSALSHGGMMVDVWVERTGIDIGGEHSSDSYYHQDGGNWKSVSDIHDMTGKQYMLNVDSLREKYGESNGTLMGSWILENFEAGKHPRTNGWPRKKWSKKMVYKPKRDRKTPLGMLKIYAKDFQSLDMPYQYIYSEMYKSWKKRFG